jgi:alkanesulfonate monooxygenase SsuD/methylene tetrahydromethanopterin reductase-like flavin-dependent oxidoreductase (luciferase family)
VQRLRVPVWVAGSAGRAKPIRRAARYDGFFPMRLQSADQLAEIVARVGALREEVGRNPDEPYEVIAELEPGVDPTPYREAGATWLLVAPDWEGISVDGLRGLIREGPAMGEPE